MDLKVLTDDNNEIKIRDYSPHEDFEIPTRMEKEKEKVEIDISGNLGGSSMSGIEALAELIGVTADEDEKEEIGGLDILSSLLGSDDEDKE